MAGAKGLRMVVLSLLALPLGVRGADQQTYAVILPLGDWRPTSAQLGTALDLLKHDAPAWERRGGRPIRPFPEYRFQSYGIREKGRRLVWLNAFCSAYWASASDWRERLIMVMDGGNCFFQAKVDVDAGKMVELVVNGEA